MEPTSKEGPVASQLIEMHVNNVVPRPGPALRCLQYGSDEKLGGALERGYD